MNSDLTDIGFAVYCALRQLYRPDVPVQYVSPRQILFILRGHIEFSKQEEKKINAGINELVNLGYISIVTVYKTGEYVLDLSQLYFDIKKDFYVMLYEDELHIILGFQNIYRYAPLRYFIQLITTFKKGKVGFYPIQYFVEEFGIDYDTILKYNKLLEKSQILYIHRASGVVILEDGDCHSIWNTYSRYEDKESAIEHSNNFIKEHGSKYQTKKKRTGNKTRSAVMKYKWFTQGKQYTYKELKEVYEVLCEYKKLKGEDFAPQDLSVFKDYDFYREEND